MTSTPLDRNLETQVDPQQEYRALIRSLKYTQGFGLLFVQCSPAEGKRLIAKVKKDLPQRSIEVLSLTGPIETLYDKVDALYQNKPIEVLFVQGIEHSLYDYEKNRFWSDEAQKLHYSETGVPRLLQHLNLSRERFRESFAFHFVFLVPHFALKYLTRRAPDFFDWRSGVLEFATEREQLRQETAQATIERFLKDNPQDLTPEECRKYLLTIQSLLEEPHQSDEYQADLLFEQARLFDIAGDEEAAIVSYDRAIDFKPHNHQAWYNRGIALSNLGRYEEAVVSYGKALDIKPDDHQVWYNRGLALGSLGRYEEAITSYNKAVNTKPDKEEAWHNRGIVLSNLGRSEEALTSYDKALEFKPDRYETWNNRGVALGNLGRYEEEIASYDKVLELKPDCPDAFYNKACCYTLQTNTEAAIANLSRAIALSPGKYREMAKTDSDFDSIRDNEQFNALVAG
jgi:tetratricopeptide (TPR) repeat protein